MSFQEKWMHVASAIHDAVYRSVNTPEMIGTDDETGCILMFFNAKGHEGKSTILSTADPSQTKKLFKVALRGIDGPKMRIIERAKYKN